MGCRWVCAAQSQRSDEMGFSPQSYMQLVVLTKRSTIAGHQAAHSSNLRITSMSLHPNRMREPHNKNGTR